MARIPMPHVIVLLPGITGTVLKKDGKTIWGYSVSSLGAALLTGGRTLRDALALPEDPPAQDDLDDDIVAHDLIPDLHLLPGFWKIDGYSKISKAILDRFEVTEGQNFFRFPYDWRRDNRVAARRLAKASHDWLARWRSKSGNTDARLILVAHSMGGLVSRYFVEVLEGWKTTEALLSFGTPYRGSLNALDMLANGMRKGPLKLTALSELGRQFTSIYQLLPIYKSYDPGDGQLVRVGEAPAIPNVDATRAAEALEFHREIERAVAENEKNPEYLARRYAIHPVVGIAQSTSLSARAAGDGVEMLPTYEGQNLGGDGTVPRVSAVPIELSDTPNAMYAATQHGSLQNADAVLTQFEGILSGSNLDLGDFRKPKVQLALDVEDLFWQNDTIVVRARPTAPTTEAVVALYASGADQPIHRLAMASDRSGGLEANFPPVPAGGYRIKVSGDDLETAESAFAVAGVEEEEAAP